MVSVRGCITKTNDATCSFLTHMIPSKETRLYSTGIRFRAMETLLILTLRGFTLVLTYTTICSVVQSLSLTEVKRVICEIFNVLTE